mmetsp:Transcript_5144/g.15380  ORF Transcript_5144/g.15380 Transcript_5144/m.15380 type:complete len:329 (-) Transcript_5144:166-1152(-)
MSKDALSRAVAEDGRKLARGTKKTAVEMLADVERMSSDKSFHSAKEVSTQDEVFFKVSISSTVSSQQKASLESEAKRGGIAFVYDDDRPTFEEQRERKQSQRSLTALSSRLVSDVTLSTFRKHSSNNHDKHPRRNLSNVEDLRENSIKSDHSSRRVPSLRSYELESSQGIHDTRDMLTNRSHTQAKIPRRNRLSSGTDERRSTLSGRLGKVLRSRQTINLYSCFEPSKCITETIVVLVRIGMNPERKRGKLVLKVPFKQDTAIEAEFSPASAGMQNEIATEMSFRCVGAKRSEAAQRLEEFLKLFKPKFAALTPGALLVLDNNAQRST